MLAFLEFLLVAWIVGAVQSEQPGCIPGPYDKNQRPHMGGPPTNVSMYVYVRNMNSIDEGKFSYNLDYILYHKYNDPRLSANCTTPDFLAGKPSFIGTSL